MDVNNFKTISLFGRIAYGVCCFENTITFLQYNVEDWKVVLKYLWEFSYIQYLDDWTGLLSEIIPENLLEFKKYEEHDYSYLDKKSYEYLYNLYQNIDEKIDFVMTAIFDIGTSHAYSEIVGYGKQSLDELKILIDYMYEKGIPLPDISLFEKFSFNENDGWGNKFNAKIISKIIV
ncbi:MAG: hypothetical protein HDT30_08495 [Clostridiales bacterium]|nr:hypothetical protein [Clostridiales bacterium]